MKKIVTTSLCLLMAFATTAQERNNWNFTHGWSDETIVNIEQAVVNSDGWTIEKGHPEGRYVTDARTPGTELTVNVDGQPWVIPETKGLLFGASSSNHIGIAFDDAYGFWGKTFLWINGSKTEDTFTIPNVNGNDRIFIVYEPAMEGQTRGFKAITEGVYVDGTDPNDGITQVETSVLDTAVFKVEPLYGMESTNVTFQATAGFYIYRVCVGQELYDDEPVVEKDKVAYIYDSGFEGYDKAADMPLDLITYELPNRIENMELVEIDAAQADGSVTKDSLMAFEAVVVSGAMRKDNSMAQTVKEAVAYVPMVNLSPELYDTWGYAMAVQTGMNTLYVDTTAAKSTLFEPSSASTRPYVDEDGNFSMFISGDGADGYEAPQGSYFANDSVLAWAGSTPVIHVHNMERNAYIMVPYTYPMGEPDESFIDILPNAIKMVMQTKKAVVKTAKPTVTTTLKKLATEVKFDCSTPNTTYRYTTDGSDPATNGTAYTGPFLVTEAGTIVKVVAQGDGYLPSDVVSSDPVEVKDQVATPVISVAQETGKSTVTIECATPGAEIYYNFSGVADPAAAELYLEPITMTQHSTVYAFATNYELVQSEVASCLVTVPGESVRIDTLAYMNSNDEAYPTGDICKAFSYYTTEQAVDGAGQPLYDDLGNPIYLPSDSVFYQDFGNGWAVGSMGQRINNQTTAATAEIGTGVYGPLTIADHGATDGAMSFLKTNSDTDPASAWLQSTVKLQAPFDVVVFMTGQGAYGDSNSLELLVSPDSMQWTSLGMFTTIEMKNIERKVMSYEGSDNVYIKLRSVCDEGMKSTAIRTMIFDLMVLNHGELSEEYEDYADGIETVMPNHGEPVRTEVYSIGGTRLPNMQRGINIVKEIYADGSVKARKVVVK